MIYLAAAGGFYLGGCFLLAKYYLSPKRIVAAMPSDAEAILIAAPTHPVPAWVSPRLANGSEDRGRVIFVLVHGYGGSRACWGDVFQVLAARGYEVIAPAMPGHDENPDPTSGFGVKEAEAVLLATRWARSRYPDQDPPKVVLVGVSMGGAACWLASARHPELFDAVVTEGAFARLDEAVDQWFSLLMPGGRIALAPVQAMARQMSGIDPKTVNPVDAAQHWRGKPSLVIQASEDRLILGSHAERLAEAAGCELWLVPEARHAGCYTVQAEEYVDRLIQIAADLSEQQL
jgi:pimeloyl-ACP methyl ester carboxylesterase